jgi:hypothetical protein
VNLLLDLGHLDERLAHAAHAARPFLKRCTSDLVDVRVYIDVDLEVAQIWGRARSAKASLRRNDGLRPSDRGAVTLGLGEKRIEEALAKGCCEKIESVGTSAFTAVCDVVVTRDRKRVTDPCNLCPSPG